MSPDQTQSADAGSCDAAVTVVAPTTADNCGVATVTNDFNGTADASGTYPVGTTIVVWTVTDNSGNTATCSMNITVTDDEAPVAVCQDITLELGDGGPITIDPLAIDNGSSDNCSIVSFELDINTLDCIDLGPNAVTLTVTDASGNQSSCTAIVTLVDNTAPVLVCNDVTVELDEDGLATLSPELLTTYPIADNCGTPTVSIDVEEVSCADVGSPVTVTITATDENGNTATCTAIVTVLDTTAPEIFCPEDQEVNVGADGTYTLGDYVADGSVSATDNCSDPVTIFTQNPLPGTSLGIGIQVVTFTAEDESGNISTCSFELDVQDSLGNNDPEDFASLVLYPIPADRIVNLSNPRQIELSEILIFDITGRIVKRIDSISVTSELSIDISHLENATYMVVIKGTRGMYTKQLIVNNY